MAIIHSRVTSQGQISVPAEIRKKLGIGPGSVLEWDERRGEVVVRKAGRYTSADIHGALFGGATHVRQGQDVYERTMEQLAAAVEMLLAHAALTLQDADIVESALETFRLRPGLGFSDCLILHTARKAGHLPLGTFDRRFAKLEDAQLL